MKKVLIGFTDIAHQISEYKKGYEALGFKVTTIIERKNPHGKSHNYNFVLYSLIPNFLKNRKSFIVKLFKVLYIKIIYYPLYITFLFILILKHDYFHFIWLRGKQWHFFLKFIKLLNKKLIISFVGDDIRYRPLYVQEFNKLGFDHPPIDILMNTQKYPQKQLKINLRTLRLGEKYADLVLSVPDQSQLSLRPYLLLEIPFDASSINFIIHNREIPIVLHATTEWEIKGTKFIIEKINILQKKYKNLFNFKLLENVQHDKLLHELSNADIVVYSPMIKGIGKFGLEAMASGCLLLTGYDFNYNHNNNIPIIPITIDDFLFKLEYYIRHKEERNRIIKIAYNWVLKNNNPKTIVYNILLNINNNENLIAPKYFRYEATFNSIYDNNNTYKILNKWTNYVKNEKWYKEYIEPGNRNNLVF